MKFFKLLETLFVAITFAEEGEFETAQEILKGEEEDTEVCYSIQPIES
ncbi:MAG: hypothetical protein ACK4GE_02960 [Caldimicrobium sp.]